MGVEKIVCISVTAAIVLLLIILIPSSLSKVGPTEVGLSYDNIWGSLGDEVLTEGLKTIPPFGEIIRWPTEYQLVEYADAGNSAVRCNSRDGIQINLQASFQFVPSSNMVYKLSLKFRNFDTYKDLVKIQAKSAIRHACGDFTAEEFQTERAAVQLKMEGNVKNYTKTNYDAIVKLLQLKNIDRPIAYQVAVETSEAARADIILAENQRAQEITKASIQVDKSLQQARAIMSSAFTQGNVTVAFAMAEATALQERYKAYEDSYYTAMRTHQLTIPGILSYFGTQMISSKSGSEQVHNLPLMARLDYKNEL